MQITLLDIENTPLEIFAWQTWKTDAIEVLTDWELLSFAWKTLGDTKTNCETREGELTDKKLTKKLWDVLNDSDIVIGHNARRFDCRKANAKFLEWGFPPPKPYRIIDTLEIARRHFNLTSNRLNYLAELLDLGSKIKTDFSLWRGCMNNDSESWVKMKKYNIMDVNLLEQVYTRLRPWYMNHPNVSDRDGEQRCPKCNSLDLIKRGVDDSKVLAYQRYCCKNCKGWCRSLVYDKEKYKHLVR